MIWITISGPFTSSGEAFFVGFFALLFFFSFVFRALELTPVL